MNDHILEPRHILDVKKQQIDEQLGQLFETVAATITKASSCLESRNEPECRNLIQADAAINASRFEIERACITAIASQQPVAHDLRDIIAAMRIAGELERIADHCSDIAAITTDLETANLSEIGLSDVQEMAQQAAAMLRDALTAYNTKDLELARRIGKDDDTLDALHQSFTPRQFEAMAAQSVLIKDASRMLWIAHDLERCGDRATNIAEQVIFRVEGEDIEIN